LQGENGYGLVVSHFVHGSLLEALFVRQLKPAGEFAEALLKRGVDVHRLETKYSAEQWVSSQQLAATFAFGHLPTEEAHRQVGRALMQGFLGTLSGRLIAVALPLMSVRQFLLRTPRFMKMGVPVETVSVSEQGERNMRIEVANSVGSRGDVYAGVLEVGIEKLKATPHISVEKEGAGFVALGVRWTTP
jgi:uncharacterized protein (TIGR02265 family)